MQIIEDSTKELIVCFGPSPFFVKDQLGHWLGRIFTWMLISFLICAPCLMVLGLWSKYSGKQISTGTLGFLSSWHMLGLLLGISTAVLIYQLLGHYFNQNYVMVTPKELLTYSGPFPFIYRKKIWRATAITHIGNKRLGDPSINHKESIDSPAIPTHIYVRTKKGNFPITPNHLKNIAASRVLARKMRKIINLE